MKNIFGIMIGFFLLVWGMPALAVPVLQLDIDGGSYNPASGNPGYNPLYDPETIISPGKVFTLYALMQPFEKKTDLGDDYFLSMALRPRTSEATPSPDLGSFTFYDQTNDKTYTYQATQDMAYGNPGIPDHGIFDTYYIIFPFQFNSQNTVGIYNVQDHPGDFINFYPGSGLYYAAFDVDISGLDNNFSVHFDLFKDSKVFAPFSHDAEGDPPQAVPEPSTMLLLGLGLMGLAGLSRKRRK